jgi:cytochrome c oxidase subunit 4
MTETNGADGHAGHGPNIKAYLVVGVALSVFTATSFVFNHFAQEKTISVFAAFVAILAVAIIKATLVGAYFMHLKYDWRVTYFMLIPAFILGTMMMVVLLPDIVFAWH